jgi:hypothetical protein
VNLFEGTIFFNHLTPSVDCSIGQPLPSEMPMFKNNCVIEMNAIGIAHQRGLRRARDSMDLSKM